MTYHVKKTSQTLNIEGWSDNFFQTNENGQLSYCHQDKQIPLNQIIDKALEAGAHMPLLLRFKPILSQQVRHLRESFTNVSQEISYQGSYLPVYPIKVNQQVDVVQTLAKTQPIGLEAGSKPELLLVCAQAEKEQVIICNGYKDQQFVELASMASDLGHQVYLVIEKPYELEILKDLVASGKKLPKLGVRVRLNSVGSSHWQNTGGQRSKFGLNAIETCQLIEDLKNADMLENLNLLHFHIGSQIANIKDIRMAMKEASQWYRSLHDSGVPIKIMDIGGGLGVDYLGTANRHQFSKNYNFEEYARAVLQPLKDLCEQYSLPMPDLMSESGRAMSAHHAVFATNILSVESNRPTNAPEHAEHYLLKEFEHVLRNLKHDNVVESYHEGISVIQEVEQLFIAGLLTLEQKAYCLFLTQKLFEQVRGFLSYEQRQHREIIDDINQLDVQKVLCNMSVFQSLPDAWAIDQIFPIAPLSDLDKPLTQRTILHDLTCDSDGQIKEYAQDDGVESSMLLPNLDESQLRKMRIGFFLVGAYQETLGDIHNLFGDQDSVVVDFNEKGEIYLEHLVKGHSISQVVSLVGYKEEDLKSKLYSKIKTLQCLENKEGYQNLVKSVLDSHTYLEDQAIEPFEK